MTSEDDAIKNHRRAYAAQIRAVAAHIERAADAAEAGNYEVAQVELLAAISRELFMQITQGLAVQFPRTSGG